MQEVFLLGFMKQEYGFAKLVDVWRELLPLLLIVAEAGQEKLVTIEEVTLDNLE